MTFQSSPQLSVLGPKQSYRNSDTVRINVCVLEFWRFFIDFWYILMHFKAFITGIVIFRGLNPEPPPL